MHGTDDDVALRCGRALQGWRRGGSAWIPGTATTTSHDRCLSHVGFLDAATAGRFCV